MTRQSATLRWRRTAWQRLALCAGVFISLAQLAALAQPAAHGPDGFAPPTLTVTGHGEATAPPDQAVVQLGAVAQSSEAAAAQEQINQIMQGALKAIKALEIPARAIKTIRLALTPIYAPQQPGPKTTEPRIVGFRASQSVRVEVDDLAKVGPVIDAGIHSGANQIEGLHFRMKDDTALRQRALRLAVEEARAKAAAMAEAGDVRLEMVSEIVEGGVHLISSRAEMGRPRLAVAEAATPVEPGEVRVEASVTMRYRIGNAGKAK